MTTFLDRLKKKEVVPTSLTDEKKDKIAAQNQTPPPEDTAPAEQLKVDIFQTPNAIIIYAQIAGASVHDFGVHIEGDNDIVTIKGQRIRPNGEYFQNPNKDERESVLEECAWGKFYRQIILPAEVDAAKTEAKLREGVLMLLLPLKAAVGSGIRIAVSEA